MHNVIFSGSGVRILLTKYIDQLTSKYIGLTCPLLK